MSNFNTVIQLLPWIRGSKESSSLKSRPQVYSSCPFLVSTVHVFSISACVDRDQSRLEQLKLLYSTQSLQLWAKANGMQLQQQDKKKNGGVTIALLDV